jgi:thiol-disulfide isomerase/thioredoxin
MKKKVIIFFGVLLILAVVWMGYSSIKNLNIKNDIQNKQSELALMLSQLGQININESTSTILIFFNSECEYCQWEMQEIGKNIDKFNQHQLLLVSFEPEQEAITFLNQHGLSDYYIKSKPEKVMASFSGGVPQTLIYQDGKLARHFKGEVKIEAILEALRENEYFQTQ